MILQVVQHLRPNFISLRGSGGHKSIQQLSGRCDFVFFLSVPNPVTKASGTSDFVTSGIVFDNSSQLARNGIEKLESPVIDMLQTEQMASVAKVQRRSEAAQNSVKVLANRCEGIERDTSHPALSNVEERFDQLIGKFCLGVVLAVRGNSRSLHTSLSKESDPRPSDSEHQSTIPSPLNAVKILLEFGGNVGE